MSTYVPAPTLSRLFLAGLLAVTAAACGDDDDGNGSGNNGNNGNTSPVPSWLGTAAHLRVVGQILGDDIDIDVTGAPAEDLGILFCERNYLGDGTIEKFEVKYNFTYMSQPAELELTYEGPTEVGDYTIGSDVELEVKIELADETEFENVGASGSFSINEITGEVDAMTGVIPNNTGTYGGWMNAVLDDGNTLDASFTANCGENDD